MRLCDYCALEIQDEAVYCRYCHRELKPYAGIQGKKRCPHCAEWLDALALECEYCEHELAPASGPLLSMEPPSPTRRTWDPRDVLEDESTPAEDRAVAGAAATRSSRFFGLGAKAEPSRVADEAEILGLDTEAEQKPRRTGLFGRGRSRPEPASPEPLTPQPAVPASLWGTSYAEETPFTPSADLTARGGGTVPPAPPAPAPAGRRRNMSTALVLIALVALVTVIALALFQFGLPNLPALTLPTAPTATLTLPTAAVLPSAAPETPAAEGTPAEPAVANCLPWDEVTLADTGKTLCVYGELKRWFAVDEIPFVALFSEERGSFAIVDRTTVHYEADPGVCVMATGRVEVMGGTRPYINANGELLTCR